MTNAQKWVAAFLFLFIVLFALQSVTKNEGDTDENYDFYGDNQTVELTGAELFKNNGCVNCHGTDLHGTSSGPSLVAAKEFWKRTELINYLRNPASFGDTERIQKYKHKYSRITMPSFNNLDVKDLGKIADYVLSAQ